MLPGSAGQGTLGFRHQMNATCCKLCQAGGLLAGPLANGSQPPTLRNGAGNSVSDLDSISGRMSYADSKGTGCLGLLVNTIVMPTTVMLRVETIGYKKGF